MTYLKQLICFLKQVVFFDFVEVRSIWSMSLLIEVGEMLEET